MSAPHRGFAVAVAVAATACAGQAAPPAVVAAPQPRPGVPGGQLAATPVERPAAAAVSSAPTVLSDAARQRDAARLPLASAVVDAFPNWNGFFSSLVAEWSPDGKRIVFGSTRDGIPEIYLADPAKPDGPSRALTSGPERALDAAFSRDGKWVLFTRDHEGDENHAIWRTAPDGTGATNLTPDPTLRRGSMLLPSKRPGTMLYTTSRSSDNATSLYRQDIAGGEARQVYSQPHPGGAPDVTPDGARALFVDYRSNNDVRVLEVDTATGAAHRVYPPEGQRASLHGARYTADGARVLVATDLGDTSALLALDPATGKELARYVDRDHPVASLTALPSPTGDRIALGLDAGDHGEVKLLDARTLALQRAVAVPLGDVQVGAWRGDGRAFSILISRPDQPADVFAVDPATGKISALRRDPRPQLAALPAISSTIEHVEAFDHLTIPVNQYLPPHTAGQKLPAIVIFHGGPATSYAVRWNPYARFFVSLGYAVLEPNVRGSSGFGHAYEHADDREKRADWLRDLETVNAWVKRQTWCDAERVVVWGQSYGGYTTLMALTRQPSLWRAGVDLYGPADLRAFLLTTSASIRTAFVEEFGDVDQDAGLLDQFSPMRDVGKIARPLFVYAGARDPRVPLSEDDAIVKALRQRGVPVEYMVAANEGHTVDRRETKIELLTRTARFLEDALR
jgi:dipeptidyl aminopeptidase/acylaminoacyl peptidase